MHDKSDNNSGENIESIFMHTFLANKEVRMKTFLKEIVVFFEEYKNGQLFLRVEDPEELSLWSTIHASEGDKTVYVDVRLASRISKNIFAFKLMRVRIFNKSNVIQNK